MKAVFGDYEIDDALDRIDFPRVRKWLASTYWSPGIEQAVLERAAQYSSLVIGAYLGLEQVGYMRVVSDRTTFGWLCDVFVEETHRGKGIARSMVRFALDHPDHRGLRRWLLATRDAHAVYNSVGFGPLESPDTMMILRPSQS